MNEKLKERIALSLKVKPEDIPENPDELKALVIEKRNQYLDNRKGVKHGWN